MSNLSKTDPLLMSALLIIASEAMFASMAATIKVVSLELPNEVIVFCRNITVTLLLLPWVWRHGFTSLGTDKFHLHLIRALSGLGAMYCFFYTIAHIPLAEAALLKMSTPIFLPIIAWLWLSEYISPTVRLAILCGFIGVTFILQPSMDTFSSVSLLALLGSALAALAKVGIRKMAETEPSTRIVFYFATISAVCASIPLFWAWKTPDWHGWVLLLMLGIFGTLGQLFMTRAYSLSPSGQVGGFTYVAVLFASLYGWLFWDEWVDHWFFFGAGLICCAGFMIMYDGQRQRRRERQNLELNAGTELDAVKTSA